MTGPNYEPLDYIFASDVTTESKNDEVDSYPQSISDNTTSTHENVASTQKATGSSLDPT